MEAEIRAATFCFSTMEFMQWWQYFVVRNFIQFFFLQSGIQHDRDFIDDFYKISVRLCQLCFKTTSDTLSEVVVN